MENAMRRLKHEIQTNPRYDTGRRFMTGDADVQIDLGVVPIVDNVVSISNLSPENLSDPNTQKPDNPWLWKMQGEGKGTINPVGNNAYTAMVGQYPAQLVEAGFHGASSPIFVHNALKHKFYTGSFKASIHGDWSAIFNHFSTDLRGAYFFVKGDVQLAFNSAVKDGTIKKSITIDNEVLTPEQEKNYEAQVDKTFDKFLDIAQKAILDPAPPKIANAQAPDPGIVGVSFAMKFQHDESHLTLDFEEEINETYIKDNVISAHMMGFYVKRQVRFQEKPSVEIPDRTLRFDEEQTTEHSIEVKADALGKLSVGPVQLDTKLDERVKVMVRFRKANRNPETLRFTADTINQPQFFEAWTKDPADAVNWSYQVTMIYESKAPGVPAITYSGEEIPMAGSVPLIAQVPLTPDNLKDQIAKLT